MKNMHDLRGWNKENNKMYGVYGFETINKKIFRCNIADSDFMGLETIYSVEDDLDKYVISESTLITDINGADIFLNDIIAVKTEKDNDLLETYTVIRSKSGEYLAVNKEKSIPLIEIAKMALIAGNTFQHPNMSYIIDEDSIGI